MTSLDASLRQAVKFVVCKGAAATEALARLLAATGLPTQTVVEKVEEFERRRCNRNPSNINPVPVPPPPFTGGQCEGVSYRIVNQGRVILVGGGEFAGNFNIVVSKPIASIEFFIANLDGIEAPAPNHRVGYRIGFKDGTNLENGFWAFSSSANIASYESDSITITRTDGLPDECGDPPSPPIDPLEEWETEEDVDYTDEDDNPVTLPDVNFKFFKPCVNLDGIRFPFEIELPGGIKVCGKFGLRPDFSNILEPDIDFDVCPDEKQAISDVQTQELQDKFTVSPKIGTGLSTSDGEYSGLAGTSFNPDEESPILGVIIESSRPGIQSISQTAIATSAGDVYPPLLIPRIGYVRFQCYVDTENGLDWSYSEPIYFKQVETFIGCPWEFGAVGVEVTWETPWDGTYRELRRKSCCDACKSDDPRNDLPVVDRCRID